MSIALDALGATHLDMGSVAGIARNLLHSIISVAKVSQDALHHNGPESTLLALGGLTHPEC